MNSTQCKNCLLPNADLLTRMCRLVSQSPVVSSSVRCSPIGSLCVSGQTPCKPRRLRGYRRRFCPLPSRISKPFLSLSENFFQKALDKIAKLVYNTSNRKSEIARTVRCLHRVIPQVTDRSPPPSWDRSARQSGKYASQLRKYDKYCLYGHFAASAALKTMPELWANCAFAKNSQNRI